MFDKIQYFSSFSFAGKEKALSLQRETADNVMKVYKDYIDLLKGIGILLVLCNHGLLQTFYVSVFHMPLFFFIAGLTFVAPQWCDCRTFLVKKTNRLLVPWVFFSIVSLLAEALVGTVGENPFNGPLWFLQTMFVSLVIYGALNLCFRSRVLLNVVCCLLPVFVYVWLTYFSDDFYLPSLLIRSLESTFFIHLGCQLRRLDTLKKRPSLVLMLLSAIAFLAGGYASTCLYDTSHLIYANTGTYTYNLPLSLLTCIGGIIAVVMLSVKVQRLPAVNWLGKHSLVIMSVHFPVIERLNYLTSQLFATDELPLLNKILIALPSYGLTLLFSVGAVYFCRKYIPKLTGYSSLIPVK